MGRVALGERLGSEVAVGFAAILASLLLILNAHLPAPLARLRPSARFGRQATSGRGATAA